MFKTGQIYYRGYDTDVYIYKVLSVSNGSLQVSVLNIARDYSRVEFYKRPMVYTEAIHYDRMSAKEYKKILSKVKKILC